MGRTRKNRREAFDDIENLEDLPGGEDEVMRDEDEDEDDGTPARELRETRTSCLNCGRKITPAGICSRCGTDNSDEPDNPRERRLRWAQEEGMFGDVED